MKNEKVYVYIGRFQTPHFAQQETIRAALTKCDRLVILVGSADIARDPKNPFTFDERKQVLDSMVSNMVADEWAKGRTTKYDILPLNDFVYDNNKWLRQVHSQVSSVTKSKDVTVTGCMKTGDESTFYLKFFPQWKTDFVSEIREDLGMVMNSTAIRKDYFSEGTISENLPDETKDFLVKFPILKAAEHQELINEFEFVERYRKQMYETLPYTNIPFLTGDSVVVAAGHVLLIKRRTYPGKGLYALPGGFFDAWTDKDQVETAIRELEEETKIDVPSKVLYGNIRSVTEFGDFNRSLRWRIITKVVHIQLPDNTLPKVKGSDDAEKAMWVPLGDLPKLRSKFFEDHYSILDTLLNLE